MEDQILKELVKKYTEGTCTEEERGLLESWYINQNSTIQLTEKELKEDLHAIGKGLPLFKPARKVSIIPRIAAAAILLITFSTGIFFYLNHTAKDQTKQHIAAIVPGGNKAILTLSNGERISLTDATDGNIANQSDVKITKTANGQLVYTVSGEGNSHNSNAYNEVETPNGGEFQVVLPDGTKVWLNAASSLRFPTRFTGSRRKVELTGEGYFEVAKNKKMPFFVETRGQEVAVLGTHFNINAYKDEHAIKTTLLEGSIKLIAPFKSVVMAPGEQAALTTNGLSVTSVDTDISVAWKNGQFMFNDESIQGIMRQIARWYNVEIAYEGKPSDSRVFWGTISRFKEVSQILEILELTKSVKFKIEGRRIVVMK